MHDLLAFLNAHASCRKFTGEPITPEQERTIVETARRSPTSSNLQAYSIIGIRNQATKDRLALLTGNQSHVAESSLFLVFCADLFRLRRLNEQRHYPFHGEDTEMLIIATVDTALVAGRALIAAQAMGLGGVMVGAIRNLPDEVCDLLHLPELVYPVMGMSLGKPAAEPKPKPRLPLDAVYYREAYPSSVPGENLSDGLSLDRLIAEYDRTMDELGYLKVRPVEPENYPDFSGIYSWSEHTARRLASDNPTTRRLHMLGFLRKRGWLKQ